MLYGSFCRFLFSYGITIVNYRLVFRYTDYIRDMENAEVCIKAGLVEGRVNGKPALLNPAIKGEEYNCRNWYGDKHPEYRDCYSWMK